MQNHGDTGKAACSIRLLRNSVHNTHIAEWTPPLVGLHPFSQIGNENHLPFRRHRLQDPFCCRNRVLESARFGIRCRAFSSREKVRQVLECGSPLPLF